MDEDHHGDGAPPPEEDVKTRKLVNRLSMTLGGFGGNAEKRNARRSIAFGKTPIPEVADATTNHQ
jgi:hypothetical protein